MATYTGLALDAASHDLVLDAAGALALVTDAEAVGQHAKQRLMTYRGEWFLDTSAGLPWVQSILVRPFDAAVAASYVKSETLGTPGVTGILAFDATVDAATRGYLVRRLRMQTAFDVAVTLNMEA